MNGEGLTAVQRAREDMLLQLVSFKLGEEEFGVDILKVQEINPMVEITKVPRSPSFVEGVVNLRGRVIPVIGMRKRFGLPVKAYDKDTRIMVADIGGQMLGFVVDEVSEVLRISDKAIEPPPSLVAGVDAEYLKGVVKLEDRLLILLDLDRVFNTKQKEKLKKVSS